jgi:hypothetical protein
VLDRNNPIRAPQSNLSKSIIRPEHQPIRAVSPAVSDFRQAHRLGTPSRRRIEGSAQHAAQASFRIEDREAEAGRGEAQGKKARPVSRALELARPCLKPADSRFEILDGSDQFINGALYVDRRQGAGFTKPLPQRSAAQPGLPGS